MPLIQKVSEVFEMQLNLNEKERMCSNYTLDNYTFCLVVDKNY